MRYAVNMSVIKTWPWRCEASYEDSPPVKRRWAHIHESVHFRDRHIARDVIIESLHDRVQPADTEELKGPLIACHGFIGNFARCKVGLVTIVIL